MQIKMNKLLKTTQLIAISTALSLTGVVDAIASDQSYKFNLALESGDRDSASGK